MGNYEKALKVGFCHEGGLSDIKDDPGGLTSFGISLRFLKDYGIDLDNDGDIDSGDILSITQQKSAELYLKYFWLPGHCQDISEYPISEKMFDICINTGISRASKLIQVAANNLGAKLAVDGVLGPVSIKTINNLDCKKLLNQICLEQAKFYKNLVQNKPKSAKFLSGWLVRAACSVYSPCKTCVARRSR